MNWLDGIVVTVILLGALGYLLKAFWPRSGKGNCGCGCGSVDCKVPKPKFD